MILIARFVSKIIVKDSPSAVDVASADECNDLLDRVVQFSQEFFCGPISVIIAQPDNSA